MSKMSAAIRAAKAAARRNLSRSGAADWFERPKTSDEEDVAASTNGSESRKKRS